MAQIRKGTILIATDPCIMEDTGKPSLTIGKEYMVIGYNNDIEKYHLCIIDDENEEHYFPIKDYKEFFNIKEDK